MSRNLVRCTDRSSGVSRGLRWEFASCYSNLIRQLWSSALERSKRYLACRWMQPRWSHPAVDKAFDLGVIEDLANRQARPEVSAASAWVVVHTGRCHRSANPATPSSYTGSPRHTRTAAKPPPTPRPHQPDPANTARTASNRCSTTDNATSASPALPHSDARGTSPIRITNHRPTSTIGGTTVKHRPAQDLRAYCVRSDRSGATGSRQLMCDMWSRRLWWRCARPRLPRGRPVLLGASPVAVNEPGASVRRRAAHRIDSVPGARLPRRPNPRRLAAASD